jgi:TPR repeat protein
MSSLGDLYEHGAEVIKSAETAVYFFARAAERGQPSAYYGLARLLSESTPDEAIMVEAAKYALLAIRDLPDGLSKRKVEILLDSLMTKLSDVAKETALRLASDWMPLSFEGGPLENGPLHDSVQSPPSSILN